MDYRAVLQGLAAQAVADPAHASAYARVVLEQLERWQSEGGDANGVPGYLPESDRLLVVQAEDLEVEPLPEEDVAFGGGPLAAPIWTTRNPFVQVKVPVDMLITGVSGYCRPSFLPDGEGGAALTASEIALLSSCAQDCRDMFAAQWNIDGETQFTTDGDTGLLTPAAALVGTETNRRPLAWALMQNQTLGVRFRNLFNAIFRRFEGGDFETPPTITCGLVFYGINLRRHKL